MKVTELKISVVKVFKTVQSNPADCVPGLPTVVKLVDRETLMKEREEKKKVGSASDRRGSL